jgi:phospholipase/lecithinase/hemolysin
VDALAQELGEPAVRPSLAGGLDYAFGGATVAFQNPPPPFNAFPTVPQQVDQYLTDHHSAGDDLIVVWGGANDFIEGFSSPTGPINPTLSADTLLISLETLAQKGGREFIVPNLPPLGETPFIRGLGVPGLSAAANQWAAAFNAELAADVGDFKSDHPGVTVVSVDVAGLFQQANQPGNPFGFVNTTDATGPLVPGSVFLAAVTANDPQDYLFYDGVHPTSKSHELIGMEAAAEVLNALPVHQLVASSAENVDPAASDLIVRRVSNALLVPSTLAAMPAMAATGTLVWSAPLTHESGPQAVSATESVWHGRAIDAIFAAAGEAATDDGTWLAGSLSMLDVAVL